MNSEATSPLKQASNPLAVGTLFLVAFHKSAAKNPGQ
jgi:hypothetical protein